MVLLAGAAAAQTPFALRSVGQPLDSEDARMVARGGWGLAESDTLNPGFKNVASLYDLRHAVVKFTGYGESADNTDITGSRKTTRTLTPDIRVAAPVIKGKLALTAGFELYRSHQFKTQVDQVWYAWDDTVTGEERFQREGTFFSVPLGAAWQIRPGLVVSGTIGLANGTIRESVQTLFMDPATGTGVPLYQSNGRVQEDKFSGTAYTVGLLLSPFDRLQLAGTYTPAFDLDVDRKVEMGGVGSRFRETWQMTMPARYEAGLQLGLSDRWQLGADGQMQAYSEFVGPAEWDDVMVDEYSVNFGLERLMAFERKGGTGNLPLRLGVGYRRWAYQLGGSDVIEKTISGGTGFPFGQRMGSLDLALSYSMIGSLAENGMESKIWRMTVSVTGLEKWW